MYRPLQKDRIALNALTPNHGKQKRRPSCCMYCGKIVASCWCVSFELINRSGVRNFARDRSIPQVFGLRLDPVSTAALLAPIFLVNLA